MASLETNPTRPLLFLAENLRKKLAPSFHSPLVPEKNLTHTHTHPFNGPFSGTIRVSRYQKGKTNLDFTEARDSEWQWHQLGRMQDCTLLQTDNHASTPQLSFLLARCPSCHPTNSVKALKAEKNHWAVNGRGSNRPDVLTVIQKFFRQQNIFLQLMYYKNKVSRLGRQDDMLPPTAVQSKNCGGSKSVRGRVHSPHISSGQPTAQPRAPCSQRPYSLGSCAMGQTDGRITTLQNAPLPEGGWHDNISHSDATTSQHYETVTGCTHGKQGPDVDVESHVGKPGSDHFATTIMSVLTDLRH